MLAGERLSALIPHQGAMCLLEAVVRWDAEGILCRARSHLAADNPLRRDGRLGAACGIEYGLQAAALHGALKGGGTQPPGWFAALREAELLTDRLDVPEIGTLDVAATLEAGGAGGMIYRFALHAADGRPLLRGRATVALPAAAAPAGGAESGPGPTR